MLKSSSQIKKYPSKKNKPTRASIGAIYSAEQEAKERTILFNIHKAKILQAMLLHQKIEQFLEAKEKKIVDSIQPIWIKNNALENEIKQNKLDMVKKNYYINNFEHLKKEKKFVKQIQKVLENIKENLDYLISIVQNSQNEFVVQGISTSSVSDLKEMLSTGKVLSHSFLNDETALTITSLFQEMKKLSDALEKSNKIEKKLNELKNEVNLVKNEIKVMNLK